MARKRNNDSGAVMDEPQVTTNGEGATNGAGAQAPATLPHVPREMPADLDRMTNMFLVDPADVEADPADNGRKYAIGDVSDMVISLLENGQQSPIKVRSIPGSDMKVRLVFGFRRHAAATQINAESLYDSDKWPNGFKLMAIWDDVDAHQAFVDNLTENIKRKGLGPVDEAYSMNRLKQEFNETQGTIAKRFGVSDATVSLRLKLLEAPAPVQRKCNEGKVSVEAVLEALSYPAGSKERSEAMDMLKGGATRGQLRAKAREAAETEEAESDTRTRGGEAGTGYKKRSLKEVREFWEGIAEIADPETGPEPVNTLAQAVLKFMDGHPKMGAVALKRRLAEYKEA